MSELEIKANAEQYALKRITSTDLSTQARDKILIQDAYEKGFNDCCATVRKELSNCANCEHFEIRIMKNGRQRFVCNKLHIQIFNPTTPCDKWIKKYVEQCCSEH